MVISNEHLLTLKQLSGFGPKKIQIIAQYLQQSSFKSLSLDDLLDVLIDLQKQGRLKGIKTLPDEEDIRFANRKACRILNESENLGIKMISCFDADFPKNLLKTINEEGKEDVPLYLFYKGDISITQKKSVAIIGTREPTPEGIAAGQFIGQAFAENGYNVVSGLAIGCDTSGHKGALSAAEGVTTAFLAHGLDTIYPPENTALAEQIVANGGLLMSEYPIGEGVNRYNLVARDRLQAALADATIVIQTGVHGGTMHAVNVTALSKKPLYAVEYSRPIFSDKVEGNRHLIETGTAQSLRSSEVSQIIQLLNGKKEVEVANKKEAAGIIDDSYPVGTLFNQGE